MADESDLKSLAAFVVDECFVYLDVTKQPDTEVTPFKHPQQLEELMRKAALQIAAKGCSAAELQENIRTILDETVRTGHQRCINQLFHRADIVSILGDWLTAAINTSIYTYETAPVATLMEEEIVNRYARLLGWPGATGTLPPGGSIANLYGIVCGRTHRFPEVNRVGWAGERPCVFCSDQAHYSTLKSCGLIGVGYEGCVKVATDEHGAMLPTALREAIAAALAAGRAPFCVVATVGTTLTGAVDPIGAIADVIAEFSPAQKIWLHVDGAMGGALLHSPTHRAALHGIDRADSFVINPHKMLGVTLQCSVFLTRHPQTLCRAFCTQAAYLFNADKEYDAARFDVGDKVFQCGRRPDVLKLWLVWRHRGDEGMAAYVDRAVARHRLFNAVLVKRSRAFCALVASPNPVPCTCFFWIPPNARDEGAPSLLELVKQHAAAIDAVVPKAKLRMMQDNVAVLTMSKMDGLPNFWRMVTNGAVQWSEEEFAHFLDVIQQYCDEIHESLGIS